MFPLSICYMHIPMEISGGVDELDRGDGVCQFNVCCGYTFGSCHKMVLWGLFESDVVPGSLLLRMHQFFDWHA